MDEKRTVAPAHIGFLSEVIKIEGVNVLVTIMVTRLDVATEGTAQEAFDVKTHDITSLLTRVLSEYVGLLLPTFKPFFFHRNIGDVPPLLIIAENKTIVPEQIGLLSGITEIVGASVDVTVMVIVFEAITVGLEHSSFEVNTHVIISLLTKVLSIYVELFVPTFRLFFFHWKAGVVPPLVILAEKTTEVPVQIGLLLAEIEMVGVNVKETIMVIAFEVTDAGLAHGSLEPNTHEIISLFKSELST